MFSKFYFGKKKRFEGLCQDLNSKIVYFYQAKYPLQQSPNIILQIYHSKMFSFFCNQKIE